MLPRLTRRQWNNVIIVACLVFIGALNLPTIIKSVLLEDPYEGYPYLLSPATQPTEIHLPRVVLHNQEGQWHAEGLSELEATELSQRWRGLVGTEVNNTQYEQLQSVLGTPITVEVWYQELEEPQRITLYKLDQFWLFKSWEDKWLAISIDATYLGLPSE